MFGETPEPMGWFARPIKTVQELRGLKFRATGLSAEVFKEMGMTMMAHRRCCHPPYELAADFYRGA